MPFTALAAIALLAVTQAQPEVAATGVEKMQQDAAALRTFVQSSVSQCFLDATARLPRIETRTIYMDPATQEWLSPVQAERLDEEARAALRPRTVSEHVYYHTRYGSPLAYVRALDLVTNPDGPAGEHAIRSLEGVRILDFGYGTVGHLHLLARCSAHAVGVDVDSFFPAMYYEDGDQGPVAGAQGKPDGSVTTVHGRWPADENAVGAIAAGGPFDLITSKNTLKRGYIFPEREADPRMLINLGVDDLEFLRVLRESLKPGGLVMIYNLSPAPTPEDEPYKPWADGRCPWPRETLERAGFEVLGYDQDEDGPAREMARRLGWDATGMNPEKDLFGLWTLLRRPAM